MEQNSKQKLFTRLYLPLALKRAIIENPGKGGQESTHQSDRFIIHVNELLIRRDFFYFESDTMETELPSDVHSTKFHIHGNKLHSSHSP